MTTDKCITAVGSPAHRALFLTRLVGFSSWTKLTAPTRCAPQSAHIPPGYAVAFCLCAGARVGSGARMDDANAPHLPVHEEHFVYAEIRCFSVKPFLAVLMRRRTAFFDHLFLGVARMDQAVATTQSVGVRRCCQGKEEKTEPAPRCSAPGARGPGASEETGEDECPAFYPTRHSRHIRHQP